MDTFHNNDIYKALVPLIVEYKKNPIYELEGCIGIYKEDKFTSGVDFDYFKSLYTVLSHEDTSKTWSNLETHSHFASFFYKNNIRGRYYTKEKAQFVEKTTVSRCDIACPDRSYDIRITLKKESPVVAYVSKERPEHVRLHERWSFEYKNAWRYDLSKVAEGTSKESACLKQPLFEIELELLRNPVFLNSTSAEQLAVHLVEKTVDLLGRFDTQKQVLPYRLVLGKQWRSHDSAIGVI